MATLQERCSARKFVRQSCRYCVYKGKEHDLYISLPDQEKLQSCFELIFDKYGKEPPAVYFRKKKYELTTSPLLTEDCGYYCIQGKFKGTRGLHKIPLHRLAYIAFYGSIPAGFHIHHIDKNKHNNSADNLVALTEEEHCQVHMRDVRVSRNLFTAQPSKGLLHKLEPRKFLQDDLFNMLNAPYSDELLKSFCSDVLNGVSTPTSLLEVICSKLCCTFSEGEEKI